MRHRRWFLLLAAVLPGCGLLTDFANFSDRVDDSIEGGSRVDGASADSATRDATSPPVEDGMSPIPDASTDAPCNTKTTGFQLGSIAQNAGSKVNWSNPAGALTLSQAAATATLTMTSDKTSSLVVRGFTFAVPAKATIVGVTVEITRTGVDHEDESVRLVSWNGVGSPTFSSGDRASGAAWPALPGVQTYQAAPAGWGIALTPAIVNSRELGVALGARYRGPTTGMATVDAIRMEVTYCDPLDAQLP